MKFFGLCSVMVLVLCGSAYGSDKLNQTGAQNLLKPGQISWWTYFKSGEEHFDQRTFNVLFEVAKKHCSADMAKENRLKPQFRYSVTVLYDPSGKADPKQLKSINPQTQQLIGWTGGGRIPQLVFTPYKSTGEVADWTTGVSCDDFAK